VFSLVRRAHFTQKAPRPPPMQLRLLARLPTARDLARIEHGGDVRRGQRKLERPVSTRRPLHLTLHSTRARGDWSMLRYQPQVLGALRECARRTGVRVYDFANVGSHLHLLVRARQRPAFQAFLRSFSGIVARIVTGAKKGKPLRDGPFWRGLAWSRVVTWGREYQTVRRYIFRNRVEATHGPDARRALERGPPS
jgi:REP element-mobilizing transposase RayT